MSRSRFRADNDLNGHILRGLKKVAPAIEIVPARTLGVHELPDDELLEYASRNGLIIVSHDVSTMADFAYQRVRRNLPMAGLFLARQLDPIGPTIQSLILVAFASEAEEWEGRVVHLPI